MWLICSGRCGGALFRALASEVEIDAAGEYQSHRILQPGYACLACGAPAVDLSEVPAEMAAEQAEDQAPVSVDVLCPVCETAVTVQPEDCCPNCGSPLEL